MNRVYESLLHSAENPNPNLKSKQFLQLQLRAVENVYTEYNAHHQRIYEADVDDETREQAEVAYVQFEQQHGESFILISKLIDDLTRNEEHVARSAMALTTPVTSTHLPPLKVPLPTFDGTYENWYAFRSMFETVMSRYSFESPAIKLYHLRNSLVGKAAGIIDQEIINNNDYTAAWRLLIDRFEDKRLIIDKHIDALFNLPTLTNENAIELRRLIDTCTKNVDALRNLGLPMGDLGECMLINRIASKLDPETRKAWELAQSAGELPDYDDTIEFLRERCRVLEKIRLPMKPVIKNSRSTRDFQETKVKASVLVATHNKCPQCPKSHKLWECDDFKSASLSDKYATLRRSGLCFNCLLQGHRSPDCSSHSTCKKCKKRHHTFLHPDDGSKKPSKPVGETSSTKLEEPKPEQPSRDDNDEMNRSNFCVQPRDFDRQILLSTAMVLVHGKGDQLYPCRVLLDSGSHTSFVTEQFATLLALKRIPAKYSISGLNDIQTKVRSKVHTKVESRIANYSVCLELLVVPKITGNLPLTKIETAALSLPNDLQLADPEFDVPGKINMLLGAEVFFDMLKSGRMHIPRCSAVLQETQFGWVLSGSVPIEAKSVVHSFCTTVTEENLDRLVNRFWEIESFENDNFPPSTTEQDCLRHFEETHRRDSEGRFIVRLPFNDDKNRLGNSKRMAERRFLALEKRLDQAPELKKQYSDFLKEYESLGHMRENRTADADQTPSFYLPHHYVLKPSSTTTKLRVVFDGSATSDSGVSINQTQMIGPIVQNDLIAILLNFRSHRFAFTADIPKMYRQVALHNDDVSYQRILWREDKSQPLKTFDLLTVTYGLASSPFLATMSLRQLAIDEQESYPLAAKIVQRACYMDDILTGANTLEETIQLKNQVVKLLKRGCFSVHKFASNCIELLADVPEEQRESGIEIEDPSINVIMKTLGVAWNPVEDHFTFVLSKLTEPATTKREILSQIAKIFDPLGFVGPAVTAAKLILRELWNLNLDWDQQVPEQIGQLWRDFYNQLNCLNGVRIPRWILSEQTAVIELHGFADASDLAYGACLYSRLIRHDGVAEMKLICSKARILPRKTGNQKQITTPRAELMAAQLLTRLTAKLLASIEIQVRSIILWSDSQIVLCWIRKPPETLALFVSNRVRDIQIIGDQFVWKYIPSNSNPAGCLSRGVQPKDLAAHTLWWNGPPSLQSTEPDIEQPLMIKNEDLPELKGNIFLTTLPNTRLPLFNKISRFPVIHRAMAYVVRFCDYIRNGKKTLTKGLLQADEMKRASTLILRLVQAEMFETEIKLITTDRLVKSPLLNLSPFIDSHDGLLRVGGRLKNAQVPYEYKHQALLPDKHPLTITLIRHLHLTNLHVGQRSLLAIVRQRYWPLKAKNLIRKIVHDCVPCYRLKPKRSTQFMGDLPDYRVQPAPVFTNTGLDFAGPFKVRATTKLRSPQTTKGYICVYVCMATRCIHLELVSDLTTEAFLGSLHRFVSRRGLVERIYSDNATNFEGANNELRRLAALFQEEQHQRTINDFTTQRGIQWSFIPPHSPHFGGIWEAGVKSVKTHLKLILAEHCLSYEQFSTVLAQIESILNSRPLCPLSDDPNDIRAITPAHFLIGREFQAIAEPSYHDIPANRLSRWQFLQDLKQKFWKIWMTHYLHELQQRQKDFRYIDIDI
ncbi:uncharacterized protein LOC129742186 [Uranotaenia lowii]|uniref:uncharacterized protein LOC129742186 n=1 Tax=Uranotaenia lowii TaxID=190385 RepID=UPI0024789DFD|nr:uncharacterized protein LOC129742186 [Uranotaenia lowii]